MSVCSYNIDASAQFFLEMHKLAKICNTGHEYMYSSKEAAVKPRHMNLKLAIIPL